MQQNNGDGRSNLHPVFRKALAPFAPPINRPVRTAMVQVIDAPHPANDGELTPEDLAAIDAEFPPARFVRTPELDKRLARGDITDANAWRDSRGETRYFVTGYDANAGRWLSKDDTAGRAALDGDRSELPMAGRAAINNQNEVV